MTSHLADRELLNVAEVAAYLGIEPVTVYRWCRSGRLPCMKLGKEWRIRRAALDEFLRRHEQDTSLAGRLRSFYTVPDHVLAIAETEALLHRLDAVFLQIGEARGGTLVKYYTGGPAAVEDLRARLARHGLEVAGLEAAGRLRFVEEPDPPAVRPAALRRLSDELEVEGRSLWVTFDWVRQVDLETALRQQHELAQIVDARQLVIQTGVLERVMDDWTLVTQRRARHFHRGVVWISGTGLAITRIAPLPSA